MLLIRIFNIFAVDGNYGKRNGKILINENNPYCRLAFRADVF